ncbi:hypothetical protein RV10_GL001966 [Enterococcus pallens]|nr:hypothetical protein RV10_GL001966 [Enterococcus pallens]
MVDYRTECTRNYSYLKHETTEITNLSNFLDKVIRIMDKKQPFL